MDIEHLGYLMFALSIVSLFGGVGIVAIFNHLPSGLTMIGNQEYVCSDGPSSCVLYVEPAIISNEILAGAAIATGFIAGSVICFYYRESKPS